MQQCPKCGSTAPDDATQCSICFAALGADQSAPPPAPPAVGIPDAPPAALPLPTTSPMGADPSPQHFGAGVAVPREEDYMPIPGIPGVDNIPKDAPSPYSQPNPPAPMGLGGAPQRMTLAGDMIDDSAQSSLGHPGTGAPMAAGPPRGPSTMRQTAPSTTPGARRGGSIHSRPAAMEGREAKGFPVATVLVILLLLVGGGSFGYWFWQKQQAPKRAATQFLEAFQKKDWKTFYNLIELPAEQKAQVTEEQFVTGMGMVGNMITVKKYEIGEVTKDGDTAKVKATVTVSSTVSLPGLPAGEKTNTSEMPFKNFNGKWKLDATSARPGIPGLGGMGGGAPGQ